MLILRGNREKLILEQCEAENQFLAIFSKNKHFGLYVASQLLNKCGHYAHFGVSKKALSLSETKLQKSVRRETQLKWAWSKRV